MLPETKLPQRNPAPQSRLTLTSEPRCHKPHFPFPTSVRNPSCETLKHLWKILAVAHRFQTGFLTFAVFNHPETGCVYLSNKSIVKETNSFDVAFVVTPLREEVVVGNPEALAIKAWAIKTEMVHKAGRSITAALAQSETFVHHWRWHLLPMTLRTDTETDNNWQSNINEVIHEMLFM